MKKAKLLMFAAVAAVLTFTACNKDKNDPGDDVPVEVTAEVEYLLKGGSDILVLFDITANYTDASGEEKQETVGALPWSRKITDVKVPFTAKFGLDMTAKTEYPEKETYDVGLGHGIIYSTSDGQLKGSVSDSSMTIAQDKVSQYQQTVEGRDYLAEENIAADQ